MVAWQTRKWRRPGRPRPRHHPAARSPLDRKVTHRTDRGRRVANNSGGGTAHRIKIETFPKDRKGTPPTGRGPQGAEGHRKPTRVPALLLESPLEGRETAHRIKIEMFPQGRKGIPPTGRGPRVATARGKGSRAGGDQGTATSPRPVEIQTNQEVAVLAGGEVEIVEVARRGLGRGFNANMLIKSQTTIP